MIGRKTFRKELEQKDQQIETLIHELSGLSADVDCLIRGIRHSMIYLNRCDQSDYNVSTAIQRLESCYYIVTKKHIIDDLEKYLE